MDVERVRQPDEHREERADIHGLGDLRIRPAGIAEPLHLLVGDAIGVLRQRLDELQQEPLGGGDRRAIEIAVTQRLSRFR